MPLPSRGPSFLFVCMIARVFSPAGTFLQQCNAAVYFALQLPTLNGYLALYICPRPRLSRCFPSRQLAVEMIFHPLVWRGIPLRVIDGQPLGLFGWQGIVPAKAGVMAERMVDMVTTQLVDVEQVIYDPSPPARARACAFLFPAKG